MTAGRRVTLAGVSGFGLPALVFLFVRLGWPELTHALVTDEFGRQVVLLEGLLCVGATALYAIAGLVPFSRRWPRVLLVLAGVVCFTLPALLVAAFGPWFVTAGREG